MQQCPTCGSLNPADADVCADCGMELPGQTGAATAPSSAPQTPAATPVESAPQNAPVNAAPEAAPIDSAPAPQTPAPIEASVSDPFSGNQWSFGDDPAKAVIPEAPALDKPTIEAEAEAPAAIETPPASDAMQTAPTQVVEPSTATVPPATSPAPSSTSTGTAKLILKRGGAPTGDVFTIGASASVGRFDPESGPVDVDMASLPEAVYISRHHAEINLRDGQWMVKDLGSRNGTFVKNASGFSRVTNETALASGDEVAFGNARFEFQIA